MAYPELSGCPKCGSQRDLASVEIIEGLSEAIVRDGKLINTGYTHVLWDKSRVRTERGRVGATTPAMRCRGCGWNGTLEEVVAVSQLEGARRDVELAG